MRLKVSLTFSDILKNKIIPGLLISSIFIPHFALAKTNKTINLDNKAKKQIESFINDQYIEYSFDYEVDQSFSNLDNIKNVSKYEKTILVNGEYDFDKFLQFVKENNDSYISYGGIQDYYEFYSDEKLSYLVKLVLDIINKMIKDIPNFNKEDLGSLLANFKIFRIDPQGFIDCNEEVFIGCFTWDSCLILNDSTFEERRQRLNETYEEYEKRLIEHEIGHVLQSFSPECIEANDNLGMSNLNVGGAYKYNWSFITESAASTLIDKNNRVGKYNEERKYANLLNFTLLLNDKYTPYKLEALTMSKDSDVLFEMFDAKTDQDKKDIINIMNSIELDMYPDNYYDIVEEMYKNETGEESFGDSALYPEMIYDSKITTFKILTNNFYKNLINCMTNNSIPLKDVFFLIRQFETMISEHLDLSGFDDLNTDFYDYYNSMRNESFKLFNVSLVDYLGYQKLDEEGNLNCDLSWLNSDKKNYLINEINKTYPEDNKLNIEINLGSSK